MFHVKHQDAAALDFCTPKAAAEKTDLRDMAGTAGTD